MTVTKRNQTTLIARSIKKLEKNAEEIKQLIEFRKMFFRIMMRNSKNHDAKKRAEYENVTEEIKRSLKQLEKAITTLNIIYVKI